MLYSCNAKLHLTTVRSIESTTFLTWAGGGLIVQAIYDKYVPNLKQIETKMKVFFGRPVCVKGHIKNVSLYNVWNMMKSSFI